MQITCTNKEAKTKTVFVDAVSDEPLEFGKTYTVRAEIGKTLLEQSPGDWQGAEKEDKGK